MKFQITKILYLIQVLVLLGSFTTSYAQDKNTGSSKSASILSNIGEVPSSLTLDAADSKDINSDNLSKLKAEYEKRAANNKFPETVLDPDNGVNDGKSNPKKEEEFSKLEKNVAGDRMDPLTANIQQFGYSLLNRGISTFAPVSDVPVSSNYIVGPGDMFTINVYGKLNTELTVTIDKTGKIFIPRIGPIEVAGITVGNLEKKLRDTLSKYYSDFDISIAFKNLRVINVFFVGESRNPGSYSISSLSTLFTSLFSTGGPSKTGSLRDIRLMRDGNVISSFDMYEFLLHGTRKKDVKILSGDTIFIPKIGPVIGIAGNVNRPAIYEFKKNDKLTLRKAINMAGGIDPYAFLKRIQVERIVKNEKKVVLDFDFDRKEFKASLDKNGLIKKDASETFDIALQDRDLVKVYSISKDTKNTVSISGHVVMPGKFQFYNGMKLSNLITGYQDLLPEPYLGFGTIIRTVQPDNHKEFIKINLEKLVLGDLSDDVELNEFDEINIYSKYEVEEKPYVSIDGAVKKPGTFFLYKNMKLLDLFYMAGQFKRDTHMGRGEIHRKLPPKYEETLILFDIKDVLAKKTDSNIELKNLDKIIIFSEEDYRYLKKVVIDGEVKRPGTFDYLKGMKVKDLVFLSGYLTQKAYLDRVEITRITHTNEGTISKIIEVNLEKALNEDPAHNIDISPNDHISVRSIPDWYSSQTITLLGEVKFPGSYAFKSGERLSSILQRAGGYTDYAFLKGAFFTRPAVKDLQLARLNDLLKKQEIQLLEETAYMSEQDLGGGGSKLLQTVALRKEIISKLKDTKVTGRVIIKIDSSDIEDFQESKFDLIVNNGDSLYIPRINETVAVLGEVYNPNSVVWVKGEKVKYYLGKVGGSTKEADSENMFVIKSDGTVISQLNNDGIFFGSFYGTKIEPGDTILVPKDLSPAVDVLGITSEVTTILFNLATTTGVLWNLTGN
ncbi:MAG: SLBB domain-containing protein [Pseudomonadota bacterium]